MLVVIPPQNRINVAAPNRYPPALHSCRSCSALCYAFPASFPTRHGSLRPCALTHQLIRVDMMSEAFLPGALAKGGWEGWLPEICDLRTSCVIPMLGSR